MSSLSAGRLLFEQIYDAIGLLISKTNVAQWIGPSHPSRQTVTEKSQEPNHGVTKNQYEALMNEFLQSAGVKSKHEQKPSDCLETAIFARIEPVTPDKRLAKAATKVGALVALYFYPAHGEKELFLIGLYTACFLVVEDSGHLMIDDLARFRQRMMTGEKQPELFELMKWLFVEFDQCFPTLCANKLFTGILNAWSIFEVEYDQSPGTALIVASASPLFPKYFRNMTGSSEAYVYFLLTKQEFSMSRTKKLLHAVPELLNVTDELNDLFSFYKESVVDIERAGDIERDNFVYQEACVKGIPVIDVLQSLARQIHQRQAAVDHILKDDAQLKRLAREYMVGQMKFYLISERYRLSELELV